MGSLQNSKAATLSSQTERVSEYVIQLLQGEPTSSSQLKLPLPSTSYIALLPTIWSLLNNWTINEHQISSDVLLASVEHAVKTSSKSALKRPTVEFVARVVLLETEQHYRGTFAVGRSGVERRAFEEWITHLPQTLWELGSNNLPATEVILRFLLRLFQRKSPEYSQTIAPVRSRLVPYFSINHTTRGQLSGPYSKLPAHSSLRRLSLDLVATLLSLTGIQDDGLEVVVDLAVMGQDEQTYWSHLRGLL